jgi:ankyrin repeat protein
MRIGYYVIIFCFGSASLASVHPSNEERLLQAAQEGNVKEAKQLIESGTKVNIQDEKGYTPLHWATLQKHPDLVQLLLEKGADYKLKEYIGGLTPLDIANREKFAPIDTVYAQFFKRRTLIRKEPFVYEKKNL